MKRNYHTHTKWCRHGTGEIEDFVLEAISKGLKTIAITEHVPLRDNSERNRMSWEDFYLYDKDFNRVINKYKDKIEIIKGFECEYYKDSLDDYIMFKEKYGYNLLILGHHKVGKLKEIDVFNEKSYEDMLVYANEVTEALNTGLFDFIAHPDLVLNSYNNNIWDDKSDLVMRKIFKSCQDNDIPVEINMNGLRVNKRYPDKNAFRISKDYNLRYLINSDAHRPNELVDENYQRALDFAKELDLKVEDKLK